MGDYDVNPINMALGALAVVVVAVLFLTTLRLGWVAENRKTADIKAARYHACLGITDESLRTISSQPGGISFQATPAAQRGRPAAPLVEEHRLRPHQERRA